MANTKELRRRIKSVKNTAQITKAMQMVAATKMRRAQMQAIAGRPYNHDLNTALHNLMDKVDQTSHPFLQSPEEGSIGVVLLSTDKSLCGALNTNTFRLVQSFVKEHGPAPIEFFTVGRKGRQFVVKTEKTLQADFPNQEVVTFRESSQVATLLISLFLEKKLKEVYIIYPNFVSTLKQEPKIMQLLPVKSFHLKESAEQNENKEEGVSMREFIFEPNVNELLDETLTHFVKAKIYQALLETKASEHSARMIAMQNATDNAQDLVEDLKLTYNQTRQDAITKELLEITSASLALE